MTFSIYALLGDKAPSLTNQSLAGDLAEFFRNEECFSINFEKLPFAKSETLALWWGDWLVRVSYEEGDNVAQDSVEIGRIVGPNAIGDTVTTRKRIRVVFGEDEDRIHTNEVIYMMDFLKEIPGCIIFDPQKQDIIA